MSEIDLIVLILASLPEEFKVAVSSLEDKLMAQSGNFLTIRGGCDKLVMRQVCLKHHQNELNELAMSAQSE